MRRHGSVLLLAVRGITGKLLLLLAALAAVEAGLLAWTMARGYGNLENILKGSRVSLAFAGAMLALTAVCCLHGSDLGGGRSAYTLGRLSVGEGAVLFWWSLCYAAAFLVLMGFQLLVLLAFCRYWLTWADPAQVSPQAVFLAAHRNGFFHGLLPLEDWAVYVRNTLYALSLGVTCAAWSFWRRRDQWGVAVYGVAFLASLFFPVSTGDWANGLCFGFFTAMCAGVALYYVWREVRNGKV